MIFTNQINYNIIILYDFSDKKHADYIRALKIRTVVQNYKNNEFSNEVITDLKKIIALTNENNNQFILDEISKYECINSILFNV